MHDHVSQMANDYQELQNELTQVRHNYSNQERGYQCKILEIQTENQDLTTEVQRLMMALEQAEKIRVDETKSVVKS